jgi:hypothetical protein
MTNIKVLNAAAPTNLICRAGAAGELPLICSNGLVGAASETDHTNAHQPPLQ